PEAAYQAGLLENQGVKLPGNNVKPRPAAPKTEPQKKRAEKMTASKSSHKGSKKSTPSNHSKKKGKKR
ncbi:MAG: hypothetical protein K2J23_03795, partial [Muribaculaceae bacterium]|nr:hypothetical protein [Muribaculaceae bacterium]